MSAIGRPQYIPVSREFQRWMIIQLYGKDLYNCVGRLMAAGFTGKELCW